jgi:predicted phage-related endonuclease
VSTLTQERLLGLGGSDAKHYLSLDPYGCARQLTYEKRQVQPDYPVEEAPILERGKDLEPIIKRKYETVTGRTLMDMHLQRHLDDDFLIGHVDSAIAPVPEHIGIGVFEAKSAGREIFFRIKRQGLPEDYIVQMQHYLMVTGLQWGAYAILWPDGWQMLQFDVPRDDEIIPIMRERAVDAWRVIENGPLPERLDPDAHQCQRCPWREQCQGAALMEAAKVSGYEPDESLRPLVLEYVERRALRKEAADLLEETKEELMQRLGDRTMVESAGAKIQYYAFTKKQYVVKEHVERPLRIYPKKDA